jgi:hypothetical protein
MLARNADREVQIRACRARGTGALLATAALILLLLAAGGGGAYLWSTEHPVRLGRVTLVGPRCRSGYLVIVPSGPGTSRVTLRTRESEGVWNVASPPGWVSLPSFSPAGMPVARRAHRVGPFDVLLH